MGKIFCKRIGTNKAIEGSCRWDLISPIFELSISFRTRCSHAGFFFMFCFWKFQAEVNIYDIRHWNYDLNCYEKTDLEREEIEEDDYLGV